MSSAHNGYRVLKTFDAVVKELGGLAAVGLLCENQDVAAVCNWRRRRRRFPTKFYNIMIIELNKQGASAPDKLWGMAEKKTA